MHPMQRDSDPSKPKEFAAWAWAAGIPDPSPSRPMPIPLISPQLTAGLSEQLWHFGFRHHPELQTKWIQGGAGLGLVAQIVDEKPKVDPLEEMAEAVLKDTNPALLEAIKKAPVEERAKLIQDLEKNFDQLEKLIGGLKNIEEEGK